MSTWNVAPANYMYNGGGQVNATESRSIINANGDITGDPVIDTNDGFVRVQPSGDSNNIAYVTAATGAGARLALGANAYTFQNMVLTDSGVTFWKPIVMSSGNNINVGNAVVNLGSTGLITNPRVYTLAGQTIGNGLNGDFVVPSSMTAPGLYAIQVYALNTGSTGNPSVWANAIGYWTGTGWTSGGTATVWNEPGAGHYVQIYPQAVGGSSTWNAIRFANASSVSLDVIVTYINLVSY